MPIILSIEGNIGSGKSTLIKYLQNNYLNNSTNNSLNNSTNNPLKIYFLPEPVSIWESITDNEGVNIIEKYYANQSKYAFSFQMMAYISRLSLLRNALNRDFDIIITERSIYTDKMVFAKMLHDDGKIEAIEYKIYNMWFDEFIRDIPKVYVIYVKTNPKTAFKRVLNRSRQGETIPLEYLEYCHNYHEKWLDEYPDESIIILDGNNVINHANDDVLLSWIDTIHAWIKRLQ